jgi:hypothetical protein
MQTLGNAFLTSFTYRRLAPTVAVFLLGNMMISLALIMTSADTQSLLASLVAPTLGGSHSVWPSLWRWTDWVPRRAAWYSCNSQWGLGLMGDFKGLMGDFNMIYQACNKKQPQCLPQSHGTFLPSHWLSWASRAPTSWSSLHVVEWAWVPYSWAVGSHLLLGWLGDWPSQLLPSMHRHSHEWSLPTPATHISPPHNTGDFTLDDSTQCPGTD